MAFLLPLEGCLKAVEDFVGLLSRLGFQINIGKFVFSLLKKLNIRDLH